MEIMIVLKNEVGCEIASVPASTENVNQVLASLLENQNWTLQVGDTIEIIR